LRWSEGEVRVVGVDVTGQTLWHVLVHPVEVSGTVEAAVDPEFRELMTQLHTGTKF
jgi:misacylated tRNA(Ala) deacylase